MVEPAFKKEEGERKRSGGGGERRSREEEKEEEEEQQRRKIGLKWEGQETKQNAQVGFGAAVTFAYQEPPCSSYDEEKRCTTLSETYKKSKKSTATNS